MSTPANTTQLAAEVMFLRELLTGFFAGQVDTGAVAPDELAARIRAAADRVGELEPTFAPTALHYARLMIDRLPEGWATGDPGYSDPP